MHVFLNYSIHYSLPCVGVNYVFVWILSDVVSKNCVICIPVSPHTCQIPLSTVGNLFFYTVINYLLSSYDVAGTVLGAGDEMRYFPL